MNIRSPWVAACLLGLIAAVCAKPQPSEGFSDPEKQPGDRSGYTERPHDGEKWTGAPDVSERPPMGAGQPPAGADRPAIPPGMAGGLGPRDSSEEPPRNKFTGTWKPRDFTGTPHPHGAMGGMEAKPQGTWSPENAPSGDQFGRQGGPGGAKREESSDHPHAFTGTLPNPEFDHEGHAGTAVPPVHGDRKVRAARASGGNPAGHQPGSQAASNVGQGQGQAQSQQKEGEGYTGQRPDVSDRPPMGAGQPPAGADRPAIPPGMAGGLSPRDSSDEPPRNKFTGTWKPRDYTGTPRPHGAMGGMRGHGILNGQRPNGKSHEEFTGSHHSGEFTKMPEAKPQGTWSPENAPSGDQFGRQGGPGGARSKRDIVGGVEHP